MMEGSYRRAAAATSTGVGVACGLLFVAGEVSIWESWLKKELMEGRRVACLAVVGWTLCSTGWFVSLVVRRCRYRCREEGEGDGLS